jgi:hypothetical protein
MTDRSIHPKGDRMTMQELTPTEAEIVAAFDAAEYPAEVAQAHALIELDGQREGDAFRLLRDAVAGELR